ncbi:hypothetical protein, partial [Nocardiopsis sp. JB363]|uniref:hypothetical protein n=1 Tax=Nocardiopsis sp. JB363 TaxID=1434837 RepID=UPI001F2AF4AC
MLRLTESLRDGERTNLRVRVQNRAAITDILFTATWFERCSEHVNFEESLQKPSGNAKQKKHNGA